MLGVYISRGEHCTGCQCLNVGWALYQKNDECDGYLLLLPLCHYIGPPGDSDTAKEFILAMFMSVNPDPDNRRIFAHFTQATDTENIKRVFNDVREHVLEQNLKDYNLM